MNSRLLRALALLTLVLSGLALAACGEDSKSGNGSADPASVAPQGSNVYIEATVRPQGSQKASLDALVSKVAGNRDLGADLHRAIDKAIQSNPQDKNNSYDKDIDPWLGDRAGVFVSAVDLSGGKVPAAAVIAAKDTGKAKDVINSEADESKDAKGTYKDVDFRRHGTTAIGVVGDFVVAGNVDAFKLAVDTSKGGQSLASSQRFKEAIDTLPAARLGFGYIDGKSLFDGLARQGAVPPAALDSIKGLFGPFAKSAVTFAAVARDDGLLVETQSPAQPGRKTTPLVGELPADSWLGIGAPDVGGGLRRSLAALGNVSGSGSSADPNVIVKALEQQTGIDLQRDLASWIGDTAVFARGTSLLNLNAGVIIRTKDQKASAAALTRFQELVARYARGQGVTVSDAPSGFKVNLPGLPAGIEVGQHGDKVVIAYGKDAVAGATAGSGSLADAPGYRSAQAAIGSDVDLSGYVDFQPVLALAEGLGASSDAAYKTAKPYLDALDALVLGSKQQGGKTLGRLLLSVK